MIFYTAGDEFTETVLRKSVAEAIGRSAEEMIGIVSVVKKISGDADRYDDMNVVVVKIRKLFLSIRRSSPPKNSARDYF
ncbi:MAG: hypothetical protein WCI84_02935 [Bacteroidota bacterium]